MVSANDIELRLKEKFNAETDKINVVDESGGCGAKFLVAIGSDQFNGVGLLDRHKIINELLKDEISQIHAITLKTWTCKQYEEKINTI